MGFSFTDEILAEPASTPETPYPRSEKKVSSLTPKTHVPGSPVKERGHRYFMPEVGRWLGRDPIEESGNQNYFSMSFGNAAIQNVLFNSIFANPYNYVDNGPIGWVDVCGLFKWYGNWGGPNWTGGKKGSWPVDNPDDPIDAQDECYLKHDLCYGDCRSNHPCDTCKEKGHKPDNKKRSDCFKDCDRELSTCLKKLIDSKDPSANWKARRATKYFATSNPGPDC